RAAPNPNPGSAGRCFCAGPPLRVRFAYTALRLSLTNMAMMAGDMHRITFKYRLTDFVNILLF
ncbi:hypothetical protein, partial [Halomonas citrativorans]|uniref:hypothetical protein n=2 Tax=Halomonas TaxID=2745 RepID=UPI001D007879